MKRQRLLYPLCTAAIAAVLCGCSRKPTEPVSYRNTYTSPQQFMEGIYAADHAITAPQGYRISALIIPHHLTATASIASGLRMLQHQSFSKILLLSPDHFSQCPTLLCTGDNVYQTFFGDVRADTGTVMQLQSSPLVSLSPSLFIREHGIFAVVPYIAHYFPGVPVTPLVFSQRVPWKTEQQELLAAVGKAVDSGTLLIVSSDFSHYLTLPQAQKMDEATAEVLFSGDLDGIADLKNADQSDCPNCLLTLAALAKQRGFYNPSVVMHTNSAELLNDPSATDTTSHFSMVWYQNSDLTGNDPAVAGDVTLTRAAKPPVLSAALAAFWKGFGVRLVNLEGPLAEKCTSDPNPYIFCNLFSLWSSAKDLATHWGVMNNHMLDQGTAGVTATKQLIASGGEIPVGDDLVTASGTDLIAMTALLNPVKDSLNLAAMNQKVLAALKNDTGKNLKIVLVHGGDEYHALFPESEKKFLERFIDAGADAVLVAHSHVTSDMEIYQGKPIFHGLGNFIFDQTASTVTQTAEIVRLRKNRGQIQFETLISK